MTLLLTRIAVALAGFGAVVTAGVAFRPQRPVLVSLATEPIAAPVAPAPEQELVVVARRSTPFRQGHKPPAERYGVRSTTMSPPAPLAPKPQLILTGILWGHDPAAIVEGVPGQEAPVVLRAGEVIGPFRVARIESSRVVVTGLDTVWTLTVRQPWK
jgi:hypothetical protein